MASDSSDALGPFTPVDPRLAQIQLSTRPTVLPPSVATGSGAFPRSHTEIRTEPCPYKYGVKFQLESAKYMKTMISVLI